MSVAETSPDRTGCRLRTETLQQADQDRPPGPCWGRPSRGCRQPGPPFREGHHLPRAFRGFSKTSLRKITCEGRLSSCASLAFPWLRSTLFTASNFVLKPER